jgi:nitrogen fixation protein FixH
VSVGGNTRPTGPWWIAGGLALVVTVNLAMVAIAVGHPSAPAAEDQWTEALGWDSELARRAASQELGWSVAMEPCASSVDDTCHVAFRVVDRAGLPVDDVSGTVQIRRADATRHDRRVELAASAPGACSGPLPTVAPGIYELEIELRSRGRSWLGRDRQFLRGRP